MSAMQVFRSQIHQHEGNQEPYLGALTKLTQASLGQMKALEGAPAWEDWFVDEG